VSLRHGSADEGRSGLPDRYPNRQKHLMQKGNEAMFKQQVRECPVCTRGEATALGKLPSPERLKKCLPEYDLLECQGCRLLYLSPLPTREALDEIYLESGQFIGCADYEGERAELATQFYASRLAAMGDSTEVNDLPLRALEVGAGLAWVSSEGFPILRTENPGS
jgi:hypothetical protein